MTGSVWALAMIAVFLGAVVHGSVGFGINLVAAPILVVLNPSFIPGPLVLIAGVMVVLVLTSERASVDRGAVGWLSLGLVPGSVAGAVALTRLSRSGLELAVALGVLVAVLLTAARPRIRRTRATLTGAGALSGFASATAALAGPPVAILYQGESPRVLRGTLSGVFVAGTPITLLILACFGRFGLADFRLALILVPCTVAGFATSLVMSRFVDRYVSRTAVLIVSAAGCMVVLLKAML